MDDQEHIHMIHIASLDVADLFSKAYHSNNVGTEDQIHHLKEAAKHIRRAIPKDDDGTRYGHGEYHKAMQGEL